MVVVVPSEAERVGDAEEGKSEKGGEKSCGIHCWNKYCSSTRFFVDCGLLAKSGRCLQAWWRKGESQDWNWGGESRWMEDLQG